MSKYEEATRQAIFQYIHSGLQGQMQMGDRYAIWLFNNQVYTNYFPGMTYDPLMSQVLANNASRFLQEVHFEKQTRMEKLWPLLREAAIASPLLTVVLLTDGDDRIKGSPFDERFNALFKEHYKELKKERVPFAVVMVAEKGQFAAYSVGAASAPLAFDQLAQIVPALTPKKDGPSCPKNSPRQRGSYSSSA